MPLFEVKAPDGGLYEVRTPEGGTEKDAIRYLQNQFASQQSQEEPLPEYTPIPETGFIPSIKRGALGIRSLLGDVAPAMAGRVGEKLGIQGAGEYADRQMAEAAAEQQRIQQMYPAAVPSYTDIKSGGDLLTYVVESIGELIPSMIPSVLTGGAAGIAGRGAVIAAEKAAKSAATEAAKRELMKDSVQAAIKSGAYGGQQETLKAVRELALEAGVKAGREAAQKTALKYQAAGAVAGSAAQNIPEVYQNVAQETGVEDLGVAIVSGGFNSVLDAITPLTLLRKAGGAGITKNELIGAWYKRAGKGVLTGFATEGATEAVQEMSSAAAEKFVDNNKEFFTPQNFERFINAGLKGGIGGGAISGATNVAFGQKEEAKPTTPTQGTTTPQAAATAESTKAKVSTEEALARVDALVGGKDLGTVDVNLSEEIAKLEKENAERKAKIDKGEAHPKRVKKYEETNARIEALKAQGVKNVNKPTFTQAGGAGAGISSEPGAGGTPAGAAGSGSVGVADAASATSLIDGGKEEQQRSLIPDEKIEGKKEELDAEASAAADAPFVQWLADNGYGDKNLSAEDLVVLREQFNNQSKEVITSNVIAADQKKTEEKAAVVEETPEEKARFEAESTLVIPPGNKEVTTEITQPAPFMGEPVSGTERRFIEPKQTEEDLYPKAIQRREELKALAVAAKESEIPLAEKVKRSQSIEKVKAATSATINNDPNAKKLYKALKPEEKAQADAVIEKYKKLQENKAEPMRKRKEKQPPGVIYQPKDYKAQLKKEKAEAKAAKETPAPKKMSLLEERLADYRATRSQYKDAEGNISYYLEELEGLRGGTTIGLMSNLMHGDLRGALKEIATDTSGEFTKLDKIVANRLLKSDTLPTLLVVPSSDIGGKLGQYDAATDVAYISEDAMTSHTVLHETLHGFTLAIIKAHKDGVKFNQGVANLEKLYKHLKETYPDLEGRYGMKNLAEFVSEAMSNPDFQEQLNSLPYERGNLLINGFVEFVKDILNLLNITPGKDFTALAYALISTESILTEGRKLEVTNPPPATAALTADAKAQKEPLKPELRGLKSAEEWVNSIEGQPEPKVKKIRDTFTTVPGAKELVRLLQNERYPIKNWQDLLDKAEKITYSGNDSTAIYTEITLSTGRAEDEFLVKMYNPSNAMYKAIGEYSKARGINEDAALKELQAVFIALHEGERRHAKYLMTVPLTAEAAQQRDVIMDLVRSADIDETTANALRAKLEELVANNKQEKGFGQNSEPNSSLSLDENSDDYNVAGIRPAIREETLAKYYTPNKEIVDQIKATVQEVHKATIELNKKANYWSQPVSNIVAFYGFENYVPLKGRPDKKEAVVDDMLDFDSKYNGRELQEKEQAFDGRVSESNNPLLQTLSDGVRAALRAGRGGTYTKPDGTTEQYGITLAVKNAIDKKLLSGRRIAVIEFKDRYKVGEGDTLPTGENTFFHYNPDGSIEIYAIDNTKLREAIRRTYRTSQPLVDAANNITSLMGQFHTRYNVAFAPMNFIRDTLTNAFTMGADMGPGVVGAVASKVAQGGLARAIKVANLYRKGDFDIIEKLGEKDPYIKAMYEYIQLGGKVAYVSGIGAESQFQQMQQNLGRKKIAAAKADIDSVIDIWTNSFEFASRTAAYQVVKANYMNGPERLSEREAAVKAAGYVKNLANFEQVGVWGKGLGAIFMFFRPSATGAVRAIESLVPLFRNIDAALAGLPEGARFLVDEQGNFVKNEKGERVVNEKAIAAFRNNMLKQRASAQAMLMSLAGAGAVIYLMALMLAEEDDEGRNKVATDDLARWTRYARFHIPGTDVIFQIPWGFGLGAFASAGAQIMSCGVGNGSLKDVFNNVKDVVFDAFLPLPISRINMWENPAAWAMDSATPSFFRPFFEYAMNMDGLGREIYNNRQTRSGDAYTGGDSIPELYKDAAKMIANITNGAVDWSPNTMYFFANNYADGLTRLIHNSYNIGMVGTGQKEFNPKTDTLAFDMFFGAKSNFDAREFSKVENQIKDKERKLNMFKNDPERYMEYVAENPFDQGIVDMYNKGVNGDLKKVRELANKYRAMPGLSPKERKELLDNVKEQQNLIKRHLISVFGAYEDFN